ncbi:hypothetical protein [Bacillus sp. FSL K6-3431]|uniref:hypothetical protein n=1 Tax=Bacillus sp. FSL K6-3431 TaxID=2921500 RepID=UPI0030FB1EE9
MNSTQRNQNDVVMELVKLHIDAVRNNRQPVTPEMIEELYVKYHELYKVTNKGRAASQM